MMAVTRETIAEEVNAVLELPPKPNHVRASLGYLIVTTIIKSMAKALLAGHTIHIDGFGHFRTRVRPAGNKQVRYFHNQKHRPAASAIVALPPKRYVYFYPSAALTRYVTKT
jgi:nucleoid DNA-binding protein